MPSTRASRQFEGLIVSNRPGSGSDSFVDIFSPDYGIVGVVAKGARASKSAFAGGPRYRHLRRFVAEDSGKLLWRLDSMSVLFQPLALRSDLDWLTSLSLMVEAIHITSAAGQPEPLSIQRFATQLSCWMRARSKTQPQSGEISWCLVG